MKTISLTAGVGLLSALFALGCSGSAGDDAGAGGPGHHGGGGTPTKLPEVPGVPDTSVQTALPPLPQMVNVRGNVRGDNVAISFDPIDGATDYRVYALPKDEDVVPGADANHITVNNAIYRCAGNRLAPPVTLDDDDLIEGTSARTRVEAEVYGYTRTLEEATLGYVSTVPRDGLVPVYALGSPDKDADNSCFSSRWRESRVKQYTTSTEERDELLGENFRDDGIVFYVPADGADGTRMISTATGSDQNRPGFLLARYYFAADGPEAAVRQQDVAPAFSVFTDPAEGLVPLQRVFYQPCGSNHDELVPGMARFERARRQGDNVPLFDLHWSGITEETTLVVEAIGDLCPRPTPTGLLAAAASPAFVSQWDQHYPAYVTLADVQAASSSHEAYVNGQGDPGTKPRPVARSFLKVSPAPAPELDWFLGFENEASVGDLQEIPCENPVSCWQEWRWRSDVIDIGLLAVETNRDKFAPTLGELWVNYGDAGADVNGKLRMTAVPKGELTEDAYLYATMEVNSFSTGRRYPQMIISDQDPPVHHKMPDGNSVVVQTFGEWPSVLEVEVCDHRPWEVNNQCPRADLYHHFDPSDDTKVTSLAPNEEVGEHMGADRSTIIEAWVSPWRVYVYLDGQPYGCVDLPSRGAPGLGPVTVTFGDVLYHSDADTMKFIDYMRTYYQWDTSRHFDNLGFRSRAAAPPWDENRLPCTSTFK